MTVYQVLGRLWGRGRFSDWDEASLAYLKSLGISHLWFTGVMRHESGKPWVKGDPGSPYAISDYRDVNPYLADNADTRTAEFESFLRRLHGSGLKLLMDLVPNHAAPSCRDFVLLDSYDYDWSDTRKIDHSLDGNLETMIQVVLYWADMGVDGMRCDMVELVPPAFMAKVIAEVKRHHPGFIFIAEIYDRANYRRYADDVGFDYLYDKSGLYDALCAICRYGADCSAITRNWQSLGPLQPRMLNFLENHDEMRIASREMLGNPEKAYAALAVSALFNQASFMLYAGQEIGEDAALSENCRTSIFDSSRVPSLDRLYRHIHEGKGLSRREISVLSRYRKVLGLASDKAFALSPNFDLQYCNRSSRGFDPARHFAFLRFPEGRAELFVCNFSGIEAELDVYIPEDALPGGKAVTAHLKVGAWDFTSRVFS